MDLFNIIRERSVANSIGEPRFSTVANTHPPPPPDSNLLLVETLLASCHIDETQASQLHALLAEHPLLLLLFRAVTIYLKSWNPV
jgi:hypothetical protein